jgi:ribosomal-protein-serine acetyltransferase
MGVKTMPEQKPNILIEKISLERVVDLHNALVESSKEWFAEEMIPKPDVSMEELELATKDFLERWEKDDAYMFFILDGFTNQVIGFAFLNHVSRQYQMANLGYAIRTSRTGEGIATAAAKLVAHYGFEELGLQRLEIVVDQENAPSLKVAEKLGAVREGLLRNRLQLHGTPCDAYMHSLIPRDLGLNKPA